MEEGLSDEVRETLVTMERNIALEARLIDDLLDVTSIAQGKLQIHPENCDAHVLIAKPWRLLKEDVHTKCIVMQCELQATCWRRPRNYANCSPASAIPYRPPAPSKPH